VTIDGRGIPPITLVGPGAGGGCDRIRRGSRISRTSHAASVPKPFVAGRLANCAPPKKRPMERHEGVFTTSA